MTKRLFDTCVSALGLALGSPGLIIIALAVKFADGGPVFYRGPRVGKRGEIFQILKFRSMIPNADHVGSSSTAEDDSRITPVGRILRSTKLDEIPQLINVLAGEMSLVGPRPQVSWAVELYNEEQKQILDVTPGVTDFASLRFRDEAEILKGSSNPDKDYLKKIAPEKIRLELAYVRQHSFWLDLRIIAATLWSLMGGDPEHIVKFP